MKGDRLIGNRLEYEDPAAGLEDVEDPDWGEDDEWEWDM